MSSLTNKQTKRLKTKEFEEKKKLSFGSERFELSQAILWQIWPKSPKKCQMRQFPEKKNFFKFHKRSKKGEKMIAEPTEGVSEGGNRGKVVKKEK